MPARVLVPLMVASVIATGVVFMDRLLQARFEVELRSEALQRSSAVRARLEGGLNSRLFLTQGLVNLVALHPDIRQQEFTRLARGMMAGTTGIRSVQLARDTVVSHIYPGTGNEAALGLRLLEVPEQAPAVRRALASRHTVVAGPVSLVQGGVAFIGRTPIYLPGDDGDPAAGAYWGLATILIDTPNLLWEAGLSAPLQDGWRMALRGRDGLGAQGATFFGDAALFDSDPVRLEVSLPGGAWELGVVPERGWAQGRPYAHWLRAIGAMLVALGALTAWLWARYPTRLQADVQRATSELDAARQELEYEVDTRTAELVAANQALRESRARLAEAQQLARLGNWEWDIPSNALYWSDEIYGIFGLEPGQFAQTYDAFLEMVHPEDRPHVRETTAQALNEGTEYALDHRILRPDGSTRFVHEQGRVDRDESGAPLRMVGTVLDITQRKETEQQLEYLAYHDPLTGLPNRVLLRDRLEHALARAHRRQESVALLFIDLDRFKNVNDSFGHEEGDRLLMEVAHRLTLQMREDDTLARLGGDEFTVVLEGVADAEQVRAVVHKLMAAFAETFLIGGRELFVTASIGISVYPADTGDVDTLMRNADTAMYQAKAHGRNDFRFFSEQMSALAHERMMLEAGLSRAEARGELVLYYQPLVDAQTRETVALEALLRWRHPELGMITPDRFIHVAEESGLIIPMGRWALEAVCRHLSQWRAAGFELKRVFANICARQLMRGDVAEHLQNLLERYRLPPACIGLEITETMLLEPTEHLDEVLTKFRSLGIQVAVDDFGIGQSALVYLKRFAVDALKIDRTFVRDVTTDPNDAAIIEAIVAMAHKLNLSVVAEGVETSEQEQAVKRFGCDVLQGYLYSRPQPADSVPHMLSRAPQLPSEGLSG